VFQSTHPSRSVTYQEWVNVGMALVSIHTPLAECDSGKEDSMHIVLQDKAGPNIPVRVRRRVVQIPIEQTSISAIVRITTKIGDPAC